MTHHGVLSVTMKHTITCPHCGKPAAIVVTAAPQTIDPISAIADFVRQRCITRPDVTCTAAKAWEAYESWATESGQPSLSKKRFGMELARVAGVVSVCASRGQRTYRGIRLR